MSATCKINQFVWEKADVTESTAYLAFYGTIKVCLSMTLLMTLALLMA